MTLRENDPRSVGGYRIESRIGSGGMGVVYLGRSASGRAVAVKVVHTRYADNAEFRARFRQEIVAARRVSGAFTAPVVDADPDAERPWMATAFVPGPTLAERVAEAGPLDWPALRRLGTELAEALREIHRAEVVHRDLKPSNVLLLEGEGDDGAARVIDFGISRAASSDVRTQTGMVMGSPPFMAPEQFSRPARSAPPSMSSRWGRYSCTRPPDAALRGGERLSRRVQHRAQRARAGRTAGAAAPVGSGLSGEGTGGPSDVERGAGRTDRAAGGAD